MVQTRFLKPQGRDVGSAITFILTAALLLSTAVRLLAIDVAHWRRVRTQQGRATRIVSTGSLRGIAVDGREWAANVDDNHYVLLFPISVGTAKTDVEFWGTVVSATKRDRHGVEFVAVCDKARNCSIPQATPLFTTLSYLDPYQMHTVATAKRQNQVLLYRGRQLTATLRTLEDPRAFAAAIASEIEKGTGQ